MLLHQPLFPLKKNPPTNAATSALKIKSAVAGPLPLKISFRAEARTKKSTIPMM